MKRYSAEQKEAIITRIMPPSNAPISQLVGASLLTTLHELGVANSHSRPRVSNDNAYAESIFRTYKYRPEYPSKGFATLQDARAWVLQFVHWYNYQHKHSGLKFVTPAQPQWRRCKSDCQQATGLCRGEG